jgi:Protein of unknown function (DUF2628)
MASYVVMEPEGFGGEGDAESNLLVRDGFSWIAFFLPAIWFLWHRLWIEAALTFAATVGLAALADITDFGGAAFALSLLVSLFAGLEGAALRIDALRRRGWREIGVVEADSVDDAETRYHVETRDSAGTGLGPVAAASAGPRTQRAVVDPGPGLLLNPGRA